MTAMARAILVIVVGFQCLTLISAPVGLPGRPHIRPHRVICNKHTICCGSGCPNCCSLRNVYPSYSTRAECRKRWERFCATAIRLLPILLPIFFTLVFLAAILTCCCTPCCCLYQKCWSRTRGDPQFGPGAPYPGKDAGSPQPDSGTPLKSLEPGAETSPSCRDPAVPDPAPNTVPYGNAGYTDGKPLYPLLAPDPPNSNYLPSRPSTPPTLRPQNDGSLGESVV